MISDERVERVARALCKADHVNPDAPTSDPGDEAAWLDYVGQALRFIAAMDALKAE